MIIGTEHWDGTANPEEDLALLSGSSLSNVWHKHALVQWWQNNIGTFAVENRDHLSQWVEAFGEDETRKLIASATRPSHSDGRLDVMDLGTAVHAYAEATLLGVEMPDFAQAIHTEQLRPYQQQVDAFLVDHKVEPIALERVVFHPRWGTAGRFDAKLEMTVNGKRVRALVDYKSSENEKGVYGDSHGLQLAAYRHATHEALYDPPRVLSHGQDRIYLLNRAEVAECRTPDPVDETYIVQVTPVSYSVVPIATPEETGEYIKAAVMMHRWLGMAATLVGEKVGP